MNKTRKPKTREERTQLRRQARTFALCIVAVLAIAATTASGAAADTGTTTSSSTTAAGNSTATTSTATTAASTTTAGSSTDVTSSSVLPQDIGLSSSIKFGDSQSTEDLTLPAIPGMSWTYVTVRLIWPLAILSGSLDVMGTNSATAASSRLAAINAPADTAQTETVTIPVHGLVDTAVALAMTNTLITKQVTNCSTQQLAGPTMQILRVGFQAPPLVQTVGSYLSGPMSQLILRLNPNVTLGVKQAALQLESSLISNDVDPDVAVNVLSTDQPIPAHSRLTRIVTFSGGSSSTGLVTVGANGMTVAGNATAAEREVDLLGSRLVPLIQTQQVGTLKVPQAVHVHTNTMDLTQLGLGSLTSSGYGVFTIPIGFSAASTGGQVSDASFSISGTNTSPLLGTGANVSLLDNGVPVTSTTLTSSQGWTLTGTLPSNTVARFISLSLQVGYSGSGGTCGTILPITVSVDPTSQFTFTRGVAAGAVGFDSLPQALLPDLDVVFSQPNSFTQFQQAAQVLAGVQRLAGSSIAVSVWPYSYLPPKKTNCIVIADSNSTLSSELTPTRLKGGTVEFVGTNTATDVSIGSKQAFLTVGVQPNGSNTLSLVTPKPNPTAGTNLLSALGSTQTTWYDLTGDTAVLAPDGHIATAQVANTVAPTVAALATSWFSERWVWALMGAAGVVLVLFLLRESRRIAWSRGAIPDRRRSDRQPWQRAEWGRSQTPSRRASDPNARANEPGPDDQNDRRRE